MFRSKDIDNGRFRFSNKQSALILLTYFLGFTTLFPLIGIALTQSIYGIDGIHPQIMMGMILITLYVSVWIVREPLARSLRFFKLNIKSSIRTVFKNFVFLWIFSIISSLIISLIVGPQTSVNQEQVIESLIENPLLMVVMTVVFAPIVEELVFRGALYQSIRSKTNYKKAMFISIFLFSFLHIVPGLVDNQNLTEFIYLFQYAGLAFFMIRAFEETGSIWGAISVHALNNLVPVVLILVFGVS